MFDSSLYDAGSALVEKYEGQLRLCNKYVAELCLAHSVGSSTVQAYVRSDRLEERREVMQRWCDYVEVCMKGGADLLL